MVANYLAQVGRVAESMNGTARTCRVLQSKGPGISQQDVFQAAGERLKQTGTVTIEYLAKVQHAGWRGERLVCKARCGLPSPMTVTCIVLGDMYGVHGGLGARDCRAKCLR